MRILLVNKFLHPAGGAETVFFNEWRWLAAAGHDVIPFGMAHPANVQNQYSQYWVRQVDYEHPTSTQLINLIWSSEAARKLEKLIANTRPRVAHLHNIYHQLSPSVLPALQRAGIPAVMTVHDYKLVCPNYRLYTQGAPCVRCVESHPWHAVRYRCLKDSLAASTLAAVETTLHRTIKAYRSIARFIAPSHFVKEIMVQGGFQAEKIIVIPHAVEEGDWRLEIGDSSQSLISNLQSPFLFAGRLEKEKGVEVLLEAAVRLPHIPFVIAGDGSLASMVRECRLSNVTYVGRLAAADLACLRQRARALVMPSLWYELFGMSALEAMRDGRPVIASHIGALPELIRQEETGLLVTPGNVDELAAAIDRLWRDESLAHRLGAAGKAWVEKHHNGGQHTQQLLRLYDDVLRDA